METLFHDVRYGTRMLLKSPGFTAVAVFTIALGIGANTAIFSVVNAVLLRPLAYEHPERLFWVWENNLQKNITMNVVSPGNLFDWKKLSQTIEQFTAWDREDLNLTGEGEPERISGAHAFANFFQALGVRPLLGRTFLPEEDKPGGNRVAVVSQTLWQRRFGSDPHVLGKSLTLNGNSYTVVGVVPPDPLKLFELWVPFALTPAQLSDRVDHHLRVFGRLKTNVTLHQAQTEMTAITRRLGDLYPLTNAGAGVNLIPLKEMFVGEMRSNLLLLLGAVGFVLLIACFNVANLLLARAAARQREVAVRAALGASRLRLVRQLLTESMILTGLAATLGLMLALWGTDMLQTVMPTVNSSFNVPIPGIDKITVDGWVLGFTLGISLLTLTTFGLAPALRSSRPDLNESLKEGSRGSTTGIRSRRFRSALVVSELALALVLLVSAGLMIKSFLRLQEVNLGFNPHNLLMMTISLPNSKYPEGAQQAIFFEQLFHRVETLAGVEAAAVTNFIPLSGHWGTTGFTIEGRPPLSRGDFLSADSRTVSPNYFSAMQIPLVKGRWFNEQDREKTPHVAMINQTMARRFFPEEDPLGKRLNLGNTDHPDLWQIVGVVGDIKHFGLDAEAVPEIYRTYTQNPWSWMTLVVRTKSHPLNLTTAVRSEVWALDKTQPVYDIVTTEQLVAQSVALRRSSMVLLGIFAGLAMVLAAVGIYGVMAYSVTQRVHEIGIRMALGAQKDDVLKLIVRQGMVLALIGVAIGLVGAFVLTRLLSSLLFGVTAADPVTFAGVSLLLVGVTLLASYIPARRATRVDPMVALRYE